MKQLRANFRAQTSHLQRSVMVAVSHQSVQWGTPWKALSRAQGIRQGRGNEVWPSQEPMTREESQALGFQDPPTGQHLSCMHCAFI